jgi:hypothetical protein
VAVLVAAVRVSIQAGMKVLVVVVVTKEQLLKQVQLPMQLQVGLLTQKQDVQVALAVAAALDLQQRHHEVAMVSLFLVCQLVVAVVVGQHPVLADLAVVELQFPVLILNLAMIDDRVLTVVQTLVVVEVLRVMVELVL